MTHQKQQEAFAHALYFRKALTVLEKVWHDYKSEQDTITVPTELWEFAGARLHHCYGEQIGLAMSNATGFELQETDEA